MTARRYEPTIAEQIRLEMLYTRRDDLGRELFKIGTMTAINAVSDVNKAIGQVVFSIQNPPEVADA